ncbi:MAG: sensor histidine kinase [Bacteroidales bacterium]|nr:sensor histidine kinase [Bacteroidales bacterium]
MLKFLLVISIIIQLIAAGIALKLFRATKYALSWILITLGLLLMVFLRLIELLPFISNFQPDYFRELYIWMGVFTSVFFAAGVFLIQRIFKYMKRVEIERRKTEKRFLTAILETEEGERTRIAKDLHDGLGPLLSAIKMSVSTVESLSTDPKALEIVRNARETTDEAIRSVKDISDHLSPHMLRNFGLVRALRNYINKLVQSRRINLRMTTNLQGERFDESVEVVFYRVSSELINNTIQHSQSTEAQLSLNYEDGHLKLEYQDNGIGFEVEKMMRNPDNEGSGLSNIRSRVNSLKGQVLFDSRVGQGFRVFIQVKCSVKP